MQQTAVQHFLIRLVTHGQIHPGLFVYDTFGVRKGFKPGPAVVSAHAALPHAAEAHFAGGQVDDHIVDAPAAELEAGHGLTDAVPVPREQVERQWLRPVRQEAVQILKPVIGEDGQDGAEDFFLHHRGAGSDMVQNGGRDLQRVRGGLASDHHLVGIDQTQQPLEVLLVDDPAVVGILQRLLAVLPLDLPAQRGDQLVL